MMYLLGLAIAISIGYLTLRLIAGNKLSFYLHLFLGTALSFGIVGQIIFYLQLLGGIYNHFLPPLISLSLLGFLIWKNKDFKLTSIKFSKNLSLLILPLLAIPLWLEANYYPMGGWDAWSCWNLKAKFIYLGGEYWKDTFDPILWRSNTGYPLMLPSINVWFWHWSGYSGNVTLLNAVVITLLTAGVLLLGLQELKATQVSSTIIVLALFTLSLGNTLCISQYSDVLFGLFLLSAFVSYLLYRQHKDTGLLILTAIFIGLMSFTKNEGLGAAVILGGLIFLQKPVKPINFITSLFLACLPMLIFTLFMAPHSQAFINGVFSAEKPSTIERLGFILIYPFKEMLGAQWSGLWILVLAGIIAGNSRSFKGPLNIIGIFVLLYIGLVLAYYQINTFFEIGWWMSNTFNRIIFALMPSVFLWMGLSIFTKDA